VAQSFLRCGQFDLTTLCDCDSAMFDVAMKELTKDLAKEPGTAHDFRKVLDDKSVDAVIVATPDHWHGVMASMALEAGKHVYLEKPASYNIADGRAMLRAHANHPNLTVLVGSQQRSGSHFASAREFVRSGALGKIGFARAWVTHDRKAVPVIPDSPPPETLDYDLWLGPAPEKPFNANRVHYNWRFMRDYGTGEMGNWAAHWLDIVRWCLDLDLPTRVAGYGGIHVVHDAKEWPDTQTVLYQYPELTVLWELRIWTTFELHDSDTGAEFAGEKGSLVVTRTGWKFTPKEGEKKECPAGEMELAHARNFADSIRGLAKPVAPLDQGHKTAVLCHLGNMVGSLNREIVFDPHSETITDDKEAAALAARDCRDPWKYPA
jgi:predicted dehydrogenase